MNDLLPDESHHQYSLGAACQLCQCTPGQLRVLMEDCGVRFSSVVDDVPYLRGDDMLTVAKRCGEVRDEIGGAIDKLEAARGNVN